MPPGHPPASREVITPADLYDCRVLTAGRNSPLRLALDRAFASAERAYQHHGTSMLNCCHFAVAGMGVAIVDQTTIRAASTSVTTVPFLPEIDVSCFTTRPAGSRRIQVLDEIVA